MKHGSLQKKYMLFDLDGTLTDSGEGIMNSFQYALEQFNIQIKDKSELRRVIGPPLKQSFMEFFHMSESVADKAIEAYRVYFKEKGIYENKLYDGVTSMLHILKSLNKTIILATSKPTIFSEQILKHFDIHKYFTYISGSTLDGLRSEKEDIINYALKENNIFNPAEAIMIGDRKFDIEGAKKCNIDSIGVSYGYGSVEELKSCNPTHCAANIPELLSYLVGKNSYY
ncbi:phosphoglycolate phosphatase [Hathewaya proteolytica DSM 3090]|uniref:Phosphoglycolate phosphatase n=1 Tax=Hathewaya proteolytica DSM 3090 TaxID=1121331 RepID=A0A1M6N7P4_9CLOT|nr:HAD family hydrolase [Hathewaya proteolytica]SHJ91740.1 phosphoglycolate phosphatase [Hathewaya proteolytica DSM 3090]